MAIGQTVASLRDRGIVLQPHEAVAIAQQLIDLPCPPISGASAGPPSVDNVVLLPDGSVECGYDATPAVSEIAILLQSMLPGGAAIPGGLRYTIARALLDVEAPPFDSLDELARALVRFERGDRRETVRTLLARAGVGVTVSGNGPIVDVARMTAHAAGGPVPADRRRVALTPFDVRRELREIDRMLYEERHAAACTCAADAPRRSRRWLPAAAVLAAASVGGGAVELAHRHAAAVTPRVSLPPVIQVPAPATEKGSGVVSEQFRGNDSRPLLASAVGTSGARRPVHHARAEVTSPPHAKKVVNGRRHAGSRESQPSAIKQVLRFKWLKDAFSQKD